MYFNPRLREGGDRQSISRIRPIKDFNPRLREGGDANIKKISFLKNISIHASAKEATGNRYPRKRRCCNFNPRLREGGDEIKRFLRQPERFQSTPPRRRRPQHIVILQLSCTYLVSTTFLSTIFSFISQYVVLFFLF